MKSKKRIALITTWFPPQQSVATNRMLAFVEYLSRDFEITVFCIDESTSETIWNQQVKVYYTASNNVFSKLKDHQSDGPLKHKIKTGTRIILAKFFKNPLDKWRQKTVQQLVKVHTDRPFDIVISSYSPQETHLAAIEFLRQYNAVPWIADMRDEMSANPYINQNTKANLAAVEKLVDQYASAITSVSLPILEDFEKLCPHVAFFEEIRNGFDHNFHRNIINSPKNTIFTLGYFGTFYGVIKPDYLFEALQELVKEVPDFEFKFELVGIHQNFTIPKELNKFITTYPQIPYSNAIKKMSSMDLNIFLHPSGKRKGVYSGKLFDYISVQKPVLALVDKKDVAAQLIEGFDCGYVAEFSELEENKEMILAAFRDWQQDKIKMASDAQVRSLHRKEQVEKLSVLIRKILKV